MTALGASPRPPNTKRYRSQQYYLHSLREVVGTGEDTIRIVHTRLRSRAGELHQETADPDGTWFFGRIQPPLTDPQNTFAQDASTAIDTLSWSSRLSIMLAERLAHGRPTTPFPSSLTRKPSTAKGRCSFMLWATEPWFPCKIPSGLTNIQSRNRILRCFGPVPIITAGRPPGWQTLFG
jgi:hypothetical protein